MKMVGVTEGLDLPKVYRAKSALGLEFELELVEKSRNTIVFKDSKSGVLYKVSVKKAGSGKYIVDVNGIEHVVYSSEANGVFIDFTQPIIQDILVEAVHRERKTEEFERKPLQLEPGVLTSPISGKVVEVAVKPGQEVNSGDTVVLLESMKMIIEIKSHLKGVIEEIYVQPGSAIKRGDKLLKIREMV